MSFILDALKKQNSDNAGKQIPDLETVHQNSDFNDDSKSSHKLIIATVLLLLFVVILLLLMLLLKNNDVHNETKNAAIVDHKSSKSIVTDVSKGDLNSEPRMKSDSSEKNISENKVINKPLVVAQPVVEKVIAKRQVSQNPSSTSTSNEQNPSQTRSPNQSLDKKEIFASKSTKNDQRIDKSSLPTLIYTTHIYATEPKDRFVMLNGKAYAIGDRINSNVKVVDILENDLVLSFRGAEITLPSLEDVNP